MPRKQKWIQYDALRALRNDHLQASEETKAKLYEDLCCMETSLRADLMADSDAIHRSLWFAFRSDLRSIFLKETGVHLPICCRFPSSALYKAFREHHAAQRQHNNH